MDLPAGGPRARLNFLVEAINGLDNRFKTNFSQWASLKLRSPAHYFQASYSETISILQLISEERWKVDADPELEPDLKKAFKAAVNLLSKSLDYAKGAGYILRPVHKELLSDVRRLSERRDVTGRNGLGLHIIGMFTQLHDIWPPGREAWTAEGSDLKPNDDFDRIFNEFDALDHKGLKMQGDYEIFARHSWDLLQDACRALHIPENQASPGDYFFHNDARPTYVDYPCDSNEFLYGKGGRAGILSLKSRLGAPLLTSQEQEINNAIGRRIPRLPASKNVRTKRNYIMTHNDAIADIEDTLHEIQVLDPENMIIARPNIERLITPTCENRKEILVLYKDDLYEIVKDIYQEKFKMPLNQKTLPLTPDRREDWLKRAAREIKAARVLINSRADVAPTVYEAKKMRLAAYRLKLSRAVYMFGLFLGEKDASPTELKEALLERLDDWILHEQAWNAGDRYILKRVRLSTQTADKVQKDIETRNRNILQWREMRDETEKSPLSNYEANRSLPSEPQEPENFDPVLTEEQIKTANILLNNVLDPKFPNASDYVADVREERRRRDWFQQRVHAKLTGGPIPVWTHKRVVNPFTKGGPPNWESLARETSWDRLKYMWVMTYWRFYQLKELEL
ncbi:hypothetical protein EKO27_g7986 [Xylaria grammica]|uniref:Uncharacterized protein n=1 Tax=Xylaria grammica TaxID=363999 RepID=A0A439CY39_9PEZI|nr:hypothetical protein EKO27_g7986 [Xylaria grammica]